jgi:hypothetical protein
VNYNFFLICKLEGPEIQTRSSNCVKKLKTEFCHFAMETDMRLFFDTLPHNILEKLILLK